MIKTPFSRKIFLKRSFQTGTVLVLSQLGKDLSAFSEEDSEMYRKNPFLFAESLGLKTPIEKIILAAMLAPNSHNTQPWKVKIESDSSFLLYGDAERVLPAIDPINRQFFHTQGTFLELATLAADSLLLESKITFFPLGIPNSVDFHKKPIAKIVLIPKSKTEFASLFESLPKRQMNRSKYEGDFITLDQTSILQQLTLANTTTLRFVLGKDEIQKYHKILIDSFTTETNLKEANEVSRIWFRTKKEDIYGKRDGITLEGNGLSGLKLWLAKTYFVDLSYESWHGEASKKASIDIAKKQIESSKGLVFFVTKGKDTPLEWVKTGRDFMRFTLAIATENLSFHTMNQSLEDYDESKVYHQQLCDLLGIDKSSRIQLMGRIGKSDYNFFSPRRDLKEILI